MRRDLAFVGVLVFAFVLPWENSIVLPVVGSVGRLSGLLMVGMALLAIADARGVTLRPLPLAVPLLGAFTLWSAATAIWSLDVSATITAVTTLVQLLVMVIILWESCPTSARRERVLQAYVLGSFVAIIDGFANYLAGTEATFRRFAATGFDPNDYAVVLALGIPMAWQLLRRARGIALVVNLLYLPASLAAIALSASRGGAVAAAVALSVVVFDARHLERPARRGLVAFLVALACATPFVAPEVANVTGTALYRLGSIGSALSGSTLNERGVIWQAGLNAFEDRPLQGVGLGAFPAAVERVSGVYEVAHNSFLSVLVETGVVGAVLFGAVILSICVPLLSAKRSTAIPSMVLFATLIVAILPLSFELRKPTWFVLAMLLTYRAVQLVGAHETTTRLERTSSPTAAAVQPAFRRGG